MYIKRIVDDNFLAFLYYFVCKAHQKISNFNDKIFFIKKQKYFVVKLNPTYNL